MTVTDRDLSALAVVDCGQIDSSNPGYGRNGIVETSVRLLLTAPEEEMDAIREAFRNV